MAAPRGAAPFCWIQACSSQGACMAADRQHISAAAALLLPQVLPPALLKHLHHSPGKESANSSVMRADGLPAACASSFCSVRSSPSAVVKRNASFLFLVTDPRSPLTCLQARIPACRARAPCGTWGQSCTWRRSCSCPCSEAGKVLVLRVLGLTLGCRWPVQAWSGV